MGRRQYTVEHIETLRRSAAMAPLLPDTLIEAGGVTVVEARNEVFGLMMDVADRIAF